MNGTGYLESSKRDDLLFLLPQMLRLVGLVCDVFERVYLSKLPLHPGQDNFSPANHAQNDLSFYRRGADGYRIAWNTLTFPSLSIDAWCLFALLLC